MLKPTRTILALAAGSLVLGLVGAGVAVADEGPMATLPSHENVAAGHQYRSVIGKVVSRGPLKVRSKPTTRSQIVGEVQPNRTVEIDCKSNGESVDGNRIWYRLQERRGDGNNGNNDWENGNGNNGNNDWENGDGGTDWENGPVANGPATDGPDARSRKYGEERWVSARYVKNQSEVKYCR